MFLKSFLAVALVFMSSAAWAEGPTYELAVNGITCPFCSYGIEKKLIELDGVKTVDVDLEKHVVVVNMKDGASLDEATANKAVKDAGFSLRGFDEIAAAPN